MSTFSGFPIGKERAVDIPSAFFTELLPHIDDLGELKVTLYVFWQLQRSERKFGYLTQADFSRDQKLMQALNKTPGKAADALQESLSRAVTRGTLLTATVELEGKLQPLYFLNDPRGQAALQAIQRGEWKPTGDLDYLVELGSEPPNVFHIYEEHIGPLTPMIADSLRQAEQDYSPQWIEEAIRIAVENNVRKWRYVEAILARWKEEGHVESGKDGARDKEWKKYLGWETSNQTRD